jgi:hypothetical protein
LFIPKLIFEHGEQWRNDIDRAKLLTHPPKLSANSTSSHLVLKQEYLVKEIMKFSHEVSPSFFQGFFDML